MSETTAQGVPASVAQLSGVKIEGQFGPSVAGSGNLSFYPKGGSLYLYFSPQGPNVVAVYGNNGTYPSTPLPPDAWTQIPDADNVNVYYSVPEGSDMKLAWSTGQ
ncbi:MAG TPA: hypothetical protein VF665_11435 [Longimicrobium sp.]|uniref:hypothetical protein n=1 Tax=Longimicrobium sp. TaxID=2029185 RepID=UPI002ED9038D